MPDRKVNQAVLDEATSQKHGSTRSNLVVARRPLHALGEKFEPLSTDEQTVDKMAKHISIKDLKKLDGEYIILIAESASHSER